MAELSPQDIVWSTIGMTYSDEERMCAIRGGTWDEANQRCLFEVPGTPRRDMEPEAFAGLNNLVYTKERGWTTAEIAAAGGLTIITNPVTGTSSAQSGATVASGSTVFPANTNSGSNLPSFTGSPLGRIRMSEGASPGFGPLSPIRLGGGAAAGLPVVRGITGGGGDHRLEP